MKLPFSPSDLLQLLRWWREAGLGTEALRALPDFSAQELAILAKLTLRDSFLAAAFLHLAPKWEVSQIHDFMKLQEIDDWLREPFTVASLSKRLATERGWIPTARVASMVDALAEAGELSREGATYRPTGRVSRPLSEKEQGFLDREFAGELQFYRECLRRAPDLSRGKGSRLVFDGDDIPLWEGILGGASARFMRAISLGLVHWNGKRVLDVSFAMGYSTEAIFRAHPDASVVALDATDANRAQTEKRVERLSCELSRGLDLTIVPAEKWGLGNYRGYGAPLPFEDASFDAVFFPLNDPFVPPDLAHFVYRDLARVVKPGGEIVVASAPRPLADRPFPMRPEVATHLLFHEFCEWSAAGFHGLRPLPALLELCAKAGIEPERHFEGMAWRLAKVA